jgi:hypothetical protein
MKKILVAAFLVAACSKGAITVDDLVQQGESMKAGSSVVVQGVSWGVNGMVGGGKRLNLAGKPLEGFHQAPVVADWAPADAEKLPEIAKNAPVKLECTFDKAVFGEVSLSHCKLL